MNEEFYKTWWWLEENHPWSLRKIDIALMKVNPETGKVDDNSLKNTKMEYWIEGGPYENDDDAGLIQTHDPKLDCGGDTFEEAIMKYAELIREHYGESSELIIN